MYLCMGADKALPLRNASRRTRHRRPDPVFNVTISSPVWGGWPLGSERHPRQRVYVLAPKSGRTHQLRVAMKVGQVDAMDGRGRASGQRAPRGPLHKYAALHEAECECI